MQLMGSEAVLTDDAVCRGGFCVGKLLLNFQGF